jgi:hypothetical protein
LIGISEVESVAGLIHMAFGGPGEAILVLRHHFETSEAAFSLLTLALVTSNSNVLNGLEGEDEIAIMNVISAWVIANLMRPAHSG